MRSQRKSFDNGREREKKGEKSKETRKGKTITWRMRDKQGTKSGYKSIIKRALSHARRSLVFLTLKERCQSCGTIRATPEEGALLSRFQSRCAIKKEWKNLLKESR